MAALTVKQMRFAEVYTGNGVQAAREAGYNGSAATLSQSAIKNLANPRILEIIEAREGEYLADKVATREERQRFWSKVMMDPTISMKDRLQASVLLGKSQADFIDRTEVAVKEPSVLMIPYLSEEQWEEKFETHIGEED